MGSGTSEGVQHQTKSATTISEPGTKGSRRRERQVFPGYGAPLPWVAPSGVKSEGDSLELMSNPDVPRAADNEREEDNLVNETSRDKKMELHTSTAVNRPGTATLQMSARAGGQPTLGLKRTASAPGGCRFHQHECIPEATGGESWIVHVPKYAARTFLTALKIASAGVKLLLRTTWATATQLFRMAAAPLRWMFWRHAASHNSSSGSASTGAETNTIVAAIVEDTPQTTNHVHSQPLEAAEPAQPLLRACSAPTTLAHQLQSAVPVPCSPAPSSTVPSSPVSAPTEPPQLVTNLGDSSPAALLESALSAPANPLPMPIAQPMPAGNLDSSLMPAELAIATEAFTAPATVEVQPPSAALLQSALPVPASPQPTPAEPTMPAVVPVMPLAVRKHSGKCTKCNARSAYAARGAFGTSLCWYHMDIETPEEGLSDTCAPGQDTGRDRQRTPAERPLHLPQRAIHAPAGAVPRQRSASHARQDNGAHARRDGAPHGRPDQRAFNGQSSKQSWRLFRNSVHASLL
ncbi:hypothetical protein CVIRNUC_001960 [Coccomyxa viridis]|uniref:Uncharacterized protein n=1 Tax=Coccomyxa viridis TaxID=1274662 RepID=A0AAV1HYS5_9CHLO|nr:hypothetical protein CVIRNUC_001960 [Coccomyxa viridis]